jgi:hypothetical protein
MPITDDQRLFVIRQSLRADADASGYGRFVSDDWINKLSADVLAALKELERGQTI